MEKLVVKQIKKRIRVDGRKTITEDLYKFSIVKKKEIFHFESDWDFERCSICDKLSFPDEDVADLYAQFMYKKYGKHLCSYFENRQRCHSYHLTSKYAQ